MEGKTEQINKQQSVLEEPYFIEMIGRRKIDPADLDIIRRLADFPKDRFLELHNFFSASRENTLRDLERSRTIDQNELEQIRRFNDTGQINLLENRIAFINLFIEFAQKYDWTACWNLNVAFERRK